MAPTEEPDTTILPQNAVGHEMTTAPTTVPPQTDSTLQYTTAALATSPPLELTTWEEEDTEASKLAVTHSDTKVTRSAPVVAEGLLPVTTAHDLGGHPSPVMPLMIPEPSPSEESLHSDTQEAGGILSVAEPSTPFTSDKSVDSLYLELTQTPIMVPTQVMQTDSVNLDTDPTLFPGLMEKGDVLSEGVVQSENDTTTFSAATVLSGDGEVDTPSFPHLLDIDSELDYQYDPADAFLPVSSAISLFLLPALMFPLPKLQLCPNIPSFLMVPVL